jgi:subtilase family serine protease
MVALVVLLGSSVAQPSLQANRVVATVDNGLRAPVQGHRPAWAAANADLGSVADATPIQITVSLTRAPEVQAAFDHLTLDLQNPASPRYHQWLTPQQIGEQFGPTQHDLDALTSWLAAQGFHVDLIQPSRVSVQATGTAGLVSVAFQTSLHLYAGRFGTLRAPAFEPSVPQALAPIVAFVGGLTEVPRHTNFTQTGPILNTETNIRAVTPAGAIRPEMNLGISTHFIAPADFSVLYDLNPVYNAGTTGTGQKIMIIGGSRLNPADLSNWESLSGLASSTPNYIVGSAFVDPGQTNNGDMGEGTLDFERAYATAPGATVDMVIAQNWLSGTVNYNLITYAINTVNDPVLNMSFSACEADEPTGFVAQENSLFQQAAAQGISIFASSGDAGVDGCEQQGVAAQAMQVASISDICASSFVTCVGGTEFNDIPAASYWAGTNGNNYESALAYIPEGGWNEPNSSSATTPFIVAASGGGASTVIPKPAWQVGTGVPADGARDVPDISFSASIHNAYFSCLAYAKASCVITNGSFPLTGFGGTSASAPSMAGVAALLNQKLGTRQGNINPLLYKLFGTAPAAFHDATIASSGVSGCTASVPSLCNNSDPGPTTLTGGLAGFLLQTGFDEVTGLGSLDVSQFLTAAATLPALATTSTSLTASPSTITTTQLVQFSATVSSTASGTPTGTVQFSSNGTILGAAVALSGGKATTPALSFLTAGTYTITAYYSGDSNFAASTATLSFVVTTPVLPTPVLSLTGSAASITTQQTVTYTAILASPASGVPTGTVIFTAKPATGTATTLATVTIASGKAVTPPVSLAAGTYTVVAVYLGDTNFSGTTSAGVSLAVTSVASAISLSGVPPTSTTLTSFTPTATVVAAGSSGTPTGTVQFSVDGSVRGSAVTLAGGTAALAGFTLPAGSHTITAVYSGDAIFASSSTSASTVTAGVTFTLTPTSTSLTLASASSASGGDVISAATNNGFSGTINFSCSVALTSGAIAAIPPGCSVNPASIVFPSTLITMAQISTVAPHALPVKGAGIGLPAGVLAVLSLSGLCVSLIRRRRTRWNAVAAMILSAGLLAALAGCGSSGTPATVLSGGTTTGAYTVTVTGTSTNGTTTTTAATTFSVTVN